MQDWDVKAILKGVVSRDFKNYLKDYEEKWVFCDEPLMVLKFF